MAKQGTILVVDDNKGILTAVQMLLGTCFEKVITISTPNKIKNTLHDENVDVILAASHPMPKNRNHPHSFSKAW